jgi:hypothetical protein
MLNPFLEINWRPSLPERRKFAVSLVVGCPIVAAALFSAGRWHHSPATTSAALMVGATGTALGLVFWLLPQIARPFYIIWYGVAGGVGFVVGNALLVMIYLFVFAPIGLAMRMARRRPLGRGIDRSAPSYWHEAPPADAPEKYYRQF